VTIDLNQAEITGEQVEQAEALANQIVTENRPVRILYPPTEDELAELSLRKVPDVEGKLRVVDISDFDATACGGTHVAHTGEIGLIKVLKTERRADTTRVEFRCGGRAFHDYQQKHAILNDVATELTTGYDQVPAIVAKLRDENKAQSRELRTLRAMVLDHEAETLWQNADREAGYTLIVQAFDDRDVGEVRNLIQKLIAHPKTVVLCGIPGEKALLIVARSDDLPYDMVDVLMNGLAVWGIERGGGRPSFAQGGGVKANLPQVESALQAAAITVKMTGK
jgi:alanyl-tRNA synthetase